MSTAPEPVRSSGVTRPICQSQRIGWPVLSRCGGYQHAPDGGATHGSGAGMGTTRQWNEVVVVPAAFEVRTVTWCGPTSSVPV